MINIDLPAAPLTKETTMKIDITPTEAAVLRTLSSSTSGLGLGRTALRTLVDKLPYAPHGDFSELFNGSQLNARDGNGNTNTARLIKDYEHAFAAPSPATPTTPFEVGKSYKDDDGDTHIVLAITDQYVISKYKDSVYHVNLDGSAVGDSFVKLFPPAPPLVDKIKADTSLMSELIRANARTNSSKIVTIKAIRATYDVGLVEAKAAYEALIA